MSDMENGVSLYDIAIVGLVGRFPGADDLVQFWENLRDGVESVIFFSDEELLAAGVDPDFLKHPNYVKANAIVSDFDRFDARFFGLTPREAEMMDPQQRFFLEYAWQALENAGYDANRYDGRIGVYGGTRTSTYMLNNLYAKRAQTDTTSLFQATIGNYKDYLATQVSYRLNLKGPSFTVQTACSTSLVAVHLACQSLLNRECDIALAGGVSVEVPQIAGYFHVPGGIPSPDGHCRPFDAQAQGTITGSGVGIVVLKRLADALEDGDTIHALIKGSAINNDGARKIGYTAPSEDGQVEVITEALAVADVAPATVTYVEAHGTGTELGDPIEVAALTRVFRDASDEKGFCGLGSVKSNVGHLDAAAGVAGLIKTVLALKHKQLPPSVNFSAPNPKIDFANSPFYVVAELRDWNTNGQPRRAGISSFGIGGTNAHVIVEEAPPALPIGAGRSEHLLVLSAKTEQALEQATADLAAHLRQHPEADLADVAYTLHVGRQAFDHRRAWVCRDAADAAAALEALDPRRVFTACEESRHRPLFFMFPGQGAQHVNMGRGLYQVEPSFRATVDRCAALLAPHLGFNLLELLYPGPDGETEAAERLQQTAITQPALFVIEYALAELWRAWGLEPQALIGHSSGEFVAACLAGVFTLEQALELLVQRGRLIQHLPGGAMLSVPLPEAEIQPLLDEQLSLAAVNAPRLCTVSGPHAAIDALQARLTAQGLHYQRLDTSHAFHSAMIEPILDTFAAFVARAAPQPPTIPFVSNVTGKWITASEATNPHYWAQHLRQTVRFADGVKVLLAEEDQILLEVGPARTLSTFARQGQAQAVFPSLPHPHDGQADYTFLLTSLGRLWLSSLDVNWRALYGDERRRRVPLPTYPFARDRYWIEPPTVDGAPQQALGKKPDVADWFYTPHWKRSALPDAVEPGAWAREQSCWLLFLDGGGLGDRLAERLQQAGQDVITVVAGDAFGQIGAGAYILNPEQADNYGALFDELDEAGQHPRTIVHLWNVSPPEPKSLEKTQARGFYSLLFLAQALGGRKHPPAGGLHVGVVSNHIQEVIGDEMLHPEKATLLGPCRVIPQEYENVTCSSIDVVVPEPGSQQEQELVERLLGELASPSNAFVAYRGAHRWVEAFEPTRLDGPDQNGRPGRLREEGVYLITGGLGGIGLALAEYLAQTARARLVLVGRSQFPPRDEWERWSETHDEQDRTRHRVARLQALEALGAQVLVLSADVASLEQMQAAVAQARERFGTIHGVIHAAGIAGGGIMQLKTPQVAAEVLAPKVEGTLVLDEVFKETQLDFLVLFSSLASLLGGFGQTDYCAANAFLDAFARRNAASRAPFTLSINWDAWQEVGMAVETTTPLGLQQRREGRIQHGILPQEGVEAFGRLLSRRLNQVVVSTQDFQALFEQRKALTASSVLEELEKSRPSQTAYPRPALESDYVAPTNEIEQMVTGIWQELFGIEQVGIYDNFFDLGGHSLILLQMQSKLQERFEREIPVVQLFRYPTIHDLAKYLGQEQEESIIEPIEERGQKYRAALKRQRQQKHRLRNQRTQ